MNLRAEVLERLNEEAISVATIPGGEILFHTPSPLLLSRAASVLSKETDTIQWIEGFEHGGVFWDIGANVGVYSLYAALRKHVSILSFEPSAANFHVLARNIQLNRLSDRVGAYCMAFSPRTQLGVLNIASPSLGASLNQFGQPGDMSRYWDGPVRATHGMIGFSIDDFIAQMNPPFPNHVKLDVDGLELSILEGARITLRDERLRSVLVELSVNRESEYREARFYFEEAGLCFVSRGETQETKTESAANYIFQRIKNEKATPNLTQCNAESVARSK